MNAPVKPAPTRCAKCGYANGGAFSVCPICKVPLTPFAEKFLRYVEHSDDGCWLWRGCRTSDGYGRAHAGEFRTAGSKTALAHRLSWLLHNSDIPDGQYVCHRCDVRPCVNPDHLFLGTAKDNTQDCIAKGRARRGRLRGQEHGRARLTEKDAREVLASKDSDQALADRFGVNKTTIYSIRVGRNWKHLHPGDALSFIASVAVVVCVVAGVIA